MGDLQTLDAYYKFKRIGEVTPLGINTCFMATWKPGDALNFVKSAETIGN